jgi:copper chaperone
MNQMRLQLDGMSCMGCVGSVEGALKKLDPGAKLSVLNLEEQKLEISTQLAQPALQEMIENLGFDVLSCQAQ